jgi:hypothetical protein
MCWYCGSPVTAGDPIGRSARCPDCGKDLRVCRHCARFLPGSRGDCSESQATPEPDKERANFCDWFSLAPGFRQSGSGAADRRGAADSAKSAFDSLFGG